MNSSTPGLPVHHQLPQFTQTHVHRVGDAIQPSHPLSSPSPPTLIPPSSRVFSNETTLCMRHPTLQIKKQGQEDLWKPNPLKLKLRDPDSCQGLFPLPGRAFPVITLLFIQSSPTLQLQCIKANYFPVSDLGLFISICLILWLPFIFISHPNGWNGEGNVNNPLQ